MFAVIKTGGKQYRVYKDSILTIEKLRGTVDEIITFNTVLMIDQTIGTPVVGGAFVTGKVLRFLKDKKITVFKKQRRKNYRRKKGHRQNLALVKIIDLIK